MRDLAAEQHLSHGLSEHPLYDTWVSMMARCYNEKHKAYKCYGGRGIGVCPRWHDVRNFIEDIERILGPRPEGMTLDRKRNGLGYKPSNVRWLDQSGQIRNSRGAKLTDPDRQEIRDLHASGQWSQRRLGRKYGVSHGTIGKVVTGSGVA